MLGEGQVGDWFFSGVRLTPRAGVDAAARNFQSAELLLPAWKVASLMPILRQISLTLVPVSAPGGELRQSVIR